AAAALREAARLLPHDPGVRKDLRQTERWIELEKTLPAMQEGTATPRDSAEQIELAEFCSRCKRFHRAAVRFAAAAFAADPTRADDLRARPRYHAACAAALAAAGKGADATPLEEKERPRLRQQALDWLRADLALWAKQLKGSRRAAQAEAVRVLRQWRQDPDL